MPSDPPIAELPDADFLHSLADAADAETLPRFRAALSIESKDKPGYNFDPVTDADRQAELALRALISGRYPDHAILGEEYGETGDGPLKWVLDPVDGTLPFLCGIPVWGTLIGLTVAGCATLGMMSQPFTGERFWADPSGAWRSRHGKAARLKASDLADLSQAIVHTNSPERYKGSLQSGFEALTPRVRRVRYGGECYAMAMLAAGHMHVCIEPSLQPYDIVALIPIIEQAGGQVTGPDGARAEAGGAVVMSANARLHEQVLTILNGGA